MTTSTSPRTIGRIPVGTAAAARPVWRRRRRAFTLIELLIAVSLVAFVVLLAFEGLQVVVGARETVARVAEPTRTVDLAFEVIRKDLENAVPPNGVLAGAFTGGDYLDDRGRDGDDVLLFTTAPGPRHQYADGGIRRVEYQVVSPDGPQGEHLLVRKVVNNLLAPDEPVSDDEVVLRGVAGFNVTYWDSAAATPVDSWDSTQQNNALPIMIEIGIDLERPDPSLPPGRPLVLKRFTRHVQLPCAVAQTQGNVQGLSGSGGGF